MILPHAKKSMKRKEGGDKVRPIAERSHMEKEFDRWNRVKKNVDGERRPIEAHQRELWWVSFGANIGIEIDGKHETFERPGIVLRRFNREMVWVMPVTSQKKSSPFYAEFLHGGTTYWAALTQVRTLSTKRFLRKIGMIPQESFVAMQRKLSAFVMECENERSPAQGGAPRRPKP